MSEWTIYCHTNRDSGKRYVGMTSQTMESRWAKHLSGASRTGSKYECAAFWAAIRKHGPDAFDHEVLESGIATLEEANLAEIKWIAHFGCIAPVGYNISSGGKSASTHPETRARISASNTGKKRSPETREKLRKVASKRCESQEYRAKLRASRLNMSEDTRTKIKEAHKRRSPETYTHAHNANKLLWRVTSPDGHEFVVVGLGDVCRKYGLDKGCMSDVALGKARQHKGWTCEKLGKPSAGTATESVAHDAETPKPAESPKRKPVQLGLFG